MKNFFIIIFLIVNCLSFGQEVLSINLTKIKAITTDITSANYYPGLYKRFIEFDTTLTAKELHMIYYGKYFQDFYQPLVPTIARDSMFILLEQNNLDDALAMGKKAFKKDPVDLRTIFGLYVCYDRLLNFSEAENYQFIYYALIGTILQSGSGKNTKEAFVVMNLNDQEEIIFSLGKEIKKRRTIKGKTTCFKLQKGEDAVLNQIKKIYFNVEIPNMK